jgi:hypothetical protein
MRHYSKNDNICYYCGKSAVDKEHVPPICFFPEGCREQLIKVPSCRVHNKLYGVDDEYVRNVLTMAMNDSDISRKLYFDKSNRSFKRNPELTRKISETILDIRLSDGLKAGAFKIDVERFNKVMDKIGKGLYYYNNGHIWDTPLNVYSPNLLNRKTLTAPFVKLFKIADKEYTWSRSAGENKDVFTYKWGYDPKNIPMLRLRFYSNFIVYLFPHFVN